MQQVNGSWITSDRYMTVRGGHYSSKLAKVPSGKLEVWVSFDVAKGVSKQPQAVYDAYGEDGDGIANGKDLGGVGRRVEATVTVR